MPNVAKIEALQKEIAELRKNLANIIFDIDHNIFHVSKELEKEYTEKVGHLEFKSFQTQCAILRTKRKMEIVKEIVESKRQLDLEFVEKIVAVDFEEYANMLQEQANLMKLALKQVLQKVVLLMLLLMFILKRYALQKQIGQMRD